MAELAAPIFEIFSGIQGEGLLVGTRQVFVRFCGCNRRCAYCDTREALAPSETCAIELSPGSREFRWQRNPLSVGDVATAVSALESFHGLHHSVSLTGGEPLLHADFIAALAPVLARQALPVYLETNGTLPDALERVIEGVHHVAMDIKLESATAEPTPWDDHRRFLQIASTRSVQVKVVVGTVATEEELQRVSDLVASVAPATPVVLQPVTAAQGVGTPAPARVLHFQEIVKRRLANVWVIPQVHKLMGQK